VFNVADAAITVGGVLLAARLLLSEASLDGAPAVEVE
jgi:lipoprotein signal peptidase